MARSLAAAAEVGPNVQTLVTPANKIQMRTNLLVRVVAEADVKGRRDVGGRHVVVAAGVGRVAVCLAQLLLRPRLFYRKT